MNPQDPTTKIDQVAGTKPKKHLSKKTKLALTISAAVLALVAIVVVLVLFVFKQEEPEIVRTDADILTAHAWEKQGAPSVIWTFHADGTGEITTNKSNYYTMTWSLEQSETSDPAVKNSEKPKDADRTKSSSNPEPAATTQVLKITTGWLYELNDSFAFSLDRDADTFTVVNLTDETESTFLPLGASEQEPTELEKTEE